jgi:N-acetylmuramoyl-L-alanine amidase
MKLIDQRDTWTALPPINIPRHPAEKFLANMTIVVDPGHGGDAWKSNWKRGPAREREAEMNLRVALLLKRLLKDAGANVILTRESDTDLDLDERAAMANSAVRPDGSEGADLFISIHHNAGGGAGTNFTSVWYHGAVDDNEPDLDVARYVAHGLGRHMRTQVAKTSPVLSSHLMYPSGFGVLRTCQVPAILCECSFFSDPAEEQRLRDAAYNLREAYGIYEGLCEYAYCGRPTQSTPVADTGMNNMSFKFESDDPSNKHQHGLAALSRTTDSSSEVIRAPATQPSSPSASSRNDSLSYDQIGGHATTMITTTLSEGLPTWWGSDKNRTISSTINLTLDNQPLPFAFDSKSKTVTARLPQDLKPGEHVLWIHHANMFKNHNWPQRYLLSTNAGEQTTKSWIIDALPATRPTLASTNPSSRPTSRGAGRFRGRTTSATSRP